MTRAPVHTPDVDEMVGVVSEILLTHGSFVLVCRDPISIEFENTINVRVR
jgi:hypothetical protein